MSKMREFYKIVTPKAGGSTVAQGDPATAAPQASGEVCEEPAYTPEEPGVCEAPEEPPAQTPNEPGVCELVLQFIQVSPEAPTIFAGKTRQYRAIGHFDGGSTQDLTGAVTWSSSAPGVVSINAGGMATAQPVSGTATITATDPATGMSGFTQVDVEAPQLQSITIIPANPTIVGGGSQVFSAKGKYSDGSNPELTSRQVEWTASPASVATIDTGGRATLHGPGAATITAKDKSSGVTGSTKVTVAAPGAGARTISVQVTVANFKGEPMLGFEGIAEFKAPGAQVVTVGGEIQGGALSFPNLSLMPEGTLRFMALSRGEPRVAPSRTIPYKLPTGGVMTFSAVQGKQSAKITATTKEEAASKVGAEGTVGINIEVVEIGGSVTAEEERRRGTESTIEWEVTWGTGSFELKQE
ncbi:MAG: Ig-like domain-containing protein [Gemmataceae bacterium]|nr:Ig-like domain-containing protein [Gemmataceae bacterium]